MCLTLINNRNNLRTPPQKKATNEGGIFRIPKLSKTLPIGIPRLQEVVPEKQFRKQTNNLPQMGSLSPDLKTWWCFHPGFGALDFCGPNLQPNPMVDCQATIQLLQSHSA